MDIFFPVSADERAQWLAGNPVGEVLYGQDRIEWDLSGTEEDALWVKVDMPEDQARRYIEYDMEPAFPLREFAFPLAVLTGLEFRDAEPDDLPDAPWRLEQAAATIINRLSERIPADNLGQVRAALASEDGPEAIRRLAWVVHQENVSISVRDLDALRRLGKQAEGRMPPSLGEQVRLPD